MSDTGTMGDPRWLDDSEQRAWRGLIRMIGLLEAAIGRDLAQDRLSLADYHVLSPLSEAPDHHLRVSELAETIHWSKSRLSHQLTRMEGRGLVDRTNCPSDARGTFVAVTPAGMEAIEAAAPAHVESIRRHLLERLSREQIDALAGICEAVLRDLPSCPGETADGDPECDTPAVDACALEDAAGAGGDSGLVEPATPEAWATRR